jgi:hypothetical protein
VIKLREQQIEIAARSIAVSRGHAQPTDEDRARARRRFEKQDREKAEAEGKGKKGKKGTSPTARKYKLRWSFRKGAEHSGLGPPARHIWGELLDVSWYEKVGERYSFVVRKVGVGTLVRWTGWGEKTVKRALRELRERGYLEQVQRGVGGVGPTVYRVLLPGSSKGSQ